MKTLKFGIIGALVLATAAPLFVVQYRSREKLLAENQCLQSQINALAPQVAEHDRLTQEMAGAPSAPVDVDEQFIELQQLRVKARAQQDEIKKLRIQLAAAAVVPIHQNYPATLSFVAIPKSEWAFAGYDTPESTLQSMLWAGMQGDVNTVRDSLTPAEQTRRKAGEWQNKTDGEIADQERQRLDQVTGFEILNIQMPSEDEAHFTVYINGLDQPDQPLWMDMEKVDSGWKSDAAPYHR